VAGPFCNDLSADSTAGPGRLEPVDVGVGKATDAGRGDGDQVAPTLELGLADAASRPIDVIRPHHCGSATVAVRSQPEASTELVNDVGAGPHVKVM
jgi:hypothetical protein